LEASGLRVYYDGGGQLGRGFALDGLIQSEKMTKVPDKVWRRMRSSSALWSLVPIVDRIVEDESRPPFLQRSSRPIALHWGYWQSHDYFADVSAQVGVRLRDWLAVDSVPVSSTCGVHVRRGDYVSDSGAAGTLGAQPLDYYQRAIARMKDDGIEQFRIFTDDRDWAAEHLVGNGIQLAPIGSARDDFLGLANSAAIIMSNSSFSWWAAFLASQRGAPIVGPRKWFLDERHDYSRLMMDDWERL
jgi:hypothetical protein